MKIIRKARIEKPANEVWKVLGQDFENAHLWMALVPNTHSKDYGVKVNEAPVCGRVCEFTDKPNGFYADELITEYSDEKMEMTVEVTPQNAPSILPMLKNTLKLKVNVINNYSSEVVWESEPKLKPIGNLMYPFVKMGLGKAFSEVLEELKYFVETGKPHPRKVKKTKLAVA